MRNNNLRILVLGASGMLGNAVFRTFNEELSYETFGTVRSASALNLFSQKLHDRIAVGVDVENIDSLVGTIEKVRPDVLINCVGLVKQLAASEDVLSAIPINSTLPHRLARLCDLTGARLVHFSTDCVFSGEKGMYTELDIPDAKDVYGRTKLLGEVDYPNAVTLRTSIIGHELNGSRSLIGWFLAQNNVVKGYKRAIFSGLPTVEIAKIIRDFVIPNANLRGLYHLSSDPISKFDLLHMVAQVYKKTIEIIPDEIYTIDRSLDSSRFRRATGFKQKSWSELITNMYEFG